MYTIYQLVDPQNNLSYYVGMTLGLNSRFEQHLRLDGSNPAKDAWILGLREQGLTPLVEQLETGLSKVEARAHELTWIRRLLEQGMPLLNRSGRVEEELATEKVTAYFTSGQYDRIEDLQRQYRKLTRKRISVNELLRRLVERAEIEDILERES